MEKIIALFVSDDYIEAAIVEGKTSTPLQSESDGNRFYLYFNTANKISFSASYGMMYRNRQAGYYGDVLTKMTNGDATASQCFDVVVANIQKLASSMGNVEKTAVAFASNIPQSVRQSVVGALSVLPHVEEIDPAIVIARHYATNIGQRLGNSKYAVLYTLGNSFCMSFLTFVDDNCVDVTSSDVKGFGINPVSKVIAEKIVNSANMVGHVIPDSDNDALEGEIIRHYGLSTKVIDYFGKNPNKETIKLNTNFVCAPEKKLPVTLSRDVIKAEAAVYARQYGDSFGHFMQSKEVSALSFEKVILVGNTLAVSEVKESISTLVSGKVVTLGDDFSDFMDGFAQPEKTQSTDGKIPMDNEGTMFQMAGTEVDVPVATPSEPVYQEVATLDVMAIKKGTMVYVDTLDPRPGKGAAFQELEYQGDGIFMVTNSSRSLVAGDLAKALCMTWQQDMQLDFMITRNGCPLGKFRTRMVKRIRIK